MAVAEGEVVVMVDGDCLLCSRSARFIMRRDREAVFIFTVCESAYAKNLLQTEGLQRPESIAVVADGAMVVKSDAIIAILSRLQGWRWAAILLRCIPRRVRDAGYDWVARHRYHWFGRQTRCYRDGDAWRDRFRE